jgi:hypothetical protein
MTFPTKAAAEAWLAHHGYKPRSWGQNRARTWINPNHDDHIVVISQGPDWRWYTCEHDKS